MAISTPFPAIAFRKFTGRRYSIGSSAAAARLGIHPRLGGASVKSSPGSNDPVKTKSLLPMLSHSCKSGGARSQFSSFGYLPRSVASSCSSSRHLSFSSVLMKPTGSSHHDQTDSASRSRDTDQCADHNRSHEHPSH